MTGLIYGNIVKIAVLLLTLVTLGTIKGGNMKQINTIIFVTDAAWRFIEEIEKNEKLAYRGKFPVLHIDEQFDLPEIGQVQVKRIKKIKERQLVWVCRAS